MPANLPANVWHVADPYRPNEIGGLSADPSGQHLYVADNLRGVIHCLARGQAQGPVGDVNGDGVVDMSDVVALMKQWEDRARSPYLPQTQGVETINADLNGDGRLDRLDAQMLIEKLLQNGGL